MSVRSHERLPYLTVRITLGHGQLLAGSTNVHAQNPDCGRGTPIGTGIPCSLEVRGNRSGIPSLISYRWLQCLQKSEPSRISSFSTSTRSSRSPLHTGQHRISMRSRFIRGGKGSVRLKPIARPCVRGPFQKPLVSAFHREDCALREFRQCLNKRSLLGATSRRFVESWTMGKAGSARTGGPSRSSC